MKQEKTTLNDRFKNIGASVLSEIEPRSFELTQRYREMIFMIMLALSIFLLFAFLTYSPADPGWSHASTMHRIKNAEGFVGAWVADFCFYAFGLMTYLMPFLLLYLSTALLWLWHKMDGAAGYCSRFIGLMVMLVSFAALTSLYAPVGHHLPAGAGGMLGEMVLAVLLDAFKPLGSTLILVTLGLTGVSLLFAISWIQCIDKMGYYILQVCQCLLSACRDTLKKCFTPGVKETTLSTLLATTDEPTIERQSTPKIPTQSIDNKQGKQPLSQRIFPKLAENRAKNRAKAQLAKSAALPIIKTAQKNKATPPPEIETAPPETADIQRKSPAAMPSLNLLNASTDGKAGYSDAELETMSRDVEGRLADFNVKAKVVAVYPGPVITRFELQLAAGTKASKITGLARDLARSLSMISVRVVEVIAGKSVIGVELPNRDREMVRLREVLATPVYANSASPLTLVLGKDIAGHPMVADLGKMPHLLVAGTTGSGKSVGLNAMLLSLLYKSKPDTLRMILIDPKMLELAVYEGIPHLLAPVVTDMKQAANALRWCVAEMERRYKLMAALGVRNLAGYNKKVKTAHAVGNPIQDPLWQPNAALGDDVCPMLDPMPYIVVLIDEFADMMMVVGKKVEQLIARIAQKARAAGIHLILATQRPSVDVITGLIKANVPGRIAFQVSSRIDSRTILDQQGAEQLLGHGDMLYLPPGTGLPVRVHGAFVEDEEVHAVVKELCAQGEPDYIDGILENQHGSAPEANEEGGGMTDSEQDPVYDSAVELVTKSRRASISSVQRRFKIGYNRAARIIEAMENAGVVSSMDSSGGREVLAPPPRED